jgi:hypothetical protein
MKQFYTFIYEANLDAIYNNEFIKKGKEITRDNFDKLTLIDPTPNKRFVKWIVGNYLKLNLSNIKEQERFFNEDAPIIKSNIDLYTRNLSKIKNEKDKNIYKFKSFADFNIFVNTLQPTNSDLNRKIKQAKNDIDIFEETDEYLIVIPKTKEAACYWGKGTDWCTATKSENNMFEHYNKLGPLYIILKLHNGQPTDEKYQFHVESMQFMDNNDIPIKINTLYELMEKIPKINILINQTFEYIIKETESLDLDVLIENINNKYKLISKNMYNLEFCYDVELGEHNTHLISSIINNKEDIDDYLLIDVDLEYNILYDLCTWENQEKIDELMETKAQGEIYSYLHDAYFDNIDRLDMIERIQDSISQDLKEAGYIIEFNIPQWSTNISINYFYFVLTGKIKLNYYDFYENLLENGIIETVNINGEKLDDIMHDVSINKTQYNKNIARQIKFLN